MRPSAGAAVGPRVVTLSPMLGYDAVPNAGGTYLRRLDDALSKHSSVTHLVSNVPANRTAVSALGAPESVVLLGVAPPSLNVRWVALGVSHRLWSWLEPRCLRPFPHLPTAVDAFASPEARRLLREADVIDIQWGDLVMLAPLLRRLNPRARIIGTFHDVISQRHDRLATTTIGRTSRWHERSAAKARRAERRALRHLDLALVFSEKDAKLLDPRGVASNVRVVHPAVSAPQRPERRVSDTSPLVVFVAQLARDENREAADWLVRTIWPRVRDRVPDARLQIVGSGAQPDLVDAVAKDSSITLTGFVDDLAECYSAAAAAVVPMRQGAGVKFKVIEALLHGVPTVTTSVGAEGIAGPEMFVRLTDDADELADGVVEALRGDARQGTWAEDVRRWAQAKYSESAFEKSVTAAYFPAS